MNDILEIKLDANIINIILTFCTGIIIPIFKNIINKKNSFILIKEFKYQFLACMIFAYCFYPILILSYLKLVIFYVDYTIKNTININMITFYISIFYFTVLIFCMVFYILNIFIDVKLFKLKKICNKYIINNEYVEDVLNLSKKLKFTYLFILFLYSILFLLAFWLTAFKIIDIVIMNKIIYIVLSLWICTLIFIILQYIFYKHKFYIMSKIIVKMDYLKNNKCNFNLILHTGYNIKYENNIIDIFNSQNKLVSSFPIKQENLIAIQRHYEIVRAKQ